MQQSVPSRKRPAPAAASPLVQQPMNAQNSYVHFPQVQVQMPDHPDINNDFNFTNPYSNEQSFSDPTLSDPEVFAAALSSFQPHSNSIAPAPTTPSTDLVRRARNTQLAPHNGQREAWDGGNYGAMSGNEQEEDEAELEQKVAIAKREAQGKRKQIPPFVQKLSSFLDNNENMSLIRWSDDGRSFIVIDEDEFARRLIPELFKHNNYASFVRQLNMYGFHKTVDIKDGSLRQSEKARKGVKPASMYSHPYFRKNRPDLLWLIQKPTGKSNAKRKRDGTVKGEGGDSDDERQYSPGPDGRPPGEVGTTGNQGLAQLPRTELAAVRQELKKLQQQQGMISRMIAQLKEQNDQFYRQATAFQALHDRHENSINAILTFLATFYNRTLEGQSGQNLVNMFNNQNQTSQQQQGGVVEEYQDNGPETNDQQIQRFVKRPQLLLGAPDGPSANILQGTGAVTEPTSARQSISPPNGTPVPRGSSASVQPPNASSANRATASPAIKDDAQTPSLLDSVPEHDQMMSLINNANASNTSNASTPAFDLSALGDYSSTHGLTPDMRQEMLAMINQHGGDASTNNNALISPNPPSMQHHMENIKQNQQHIAQLEKLQEAQAQSVSGLEDKLGKLSPGGTFPPTDEFGNAMNLDPSSVNLNDWIDNYEWNYDGPGASTNDNIDFDNFGSTDDTDLFASGIQDGLDQDHLVAPGSGGKVESLSSQSDSPAGTLGLGDDGEGSEHEPGTPNKKQRIS